MLQEMSTGTPYGDNSSQLHNEPQLDALYLPHTSPAIQLPPFPNGCSPDSSPQIHHRPSLHEKQLQSLYLDTDIMQRYYPEPDMAYGMLHSSGSLQSPMYTVESSTVLARDTSTFVGDGAQPHEWATRPTNDGMLVSSQEPIYTHAYGYNQPDSVGPIDVYATPSYAISTYDSFEFQTLREHNTSVMLTSQHA